MFKAARPVVVPQPFSFRFNGRLSIRPISSRVHSNLCCDSARPVPGSGSFHNSGGVLRGEPLASAGSNEHDRPRRRRQTTSRLKATHQPRWGSCLDDRQCRLLRDVPIYTGRTTLTATPFKHAPAPKRMCLRLRAPRQPLKQMSPADLRSAHRRENREGPCHSDHSARSFAHESSPVLDHPSVAALRPGRRRRGSPDGSRHPQIRLSRPRQWRRPSTAVRSRASKSPRVGFLWS
jgi:hypothetical protein